MDAKSRQSRLQAQQELRIFSACLQLIHHQTPQEKGKNQNTLDTTRPAKRASFQDGRASRQFCFLSGRERPPTRISKCLAITNTRYSVSSCSKQYSWVLESYVWMWVPAAAAAVTSNNCHTNTGVASKRNDKISLSPKISSSYYPLAKVILETERSSEGVTGVSNGRPLQYGSSCRWGRYRTVSNMSAIPRAFPSSPSMSTTSSFHSFKYKIDGLVLQAATTQGWVGTSGASPEHAVNPSTGLTHRGSILMFLLTFCFGE